jgi:hypothetical protein
MLLRLMVGIVLNDQSCLVSYICFFYSDNEFVRL